MDGNHPKRKKDKLNPYVLSIENGEYYVSFKDGQGILHKEKVEHDLYVLFDRFELEDISQLNAISRYYEHSQLTEATLNQRAMLPVEPMEDDVYRKILYEQLHTAIAALPDIQRRRVMQYYFGGCTFEQIAKMEGCTKRAVKRSVDLAVDTLRKNLKNFSD